MYVDMGTATNSCQPENRTLESPGLNPCTELETRGGIWRYDANKTNQIFSPAERFATGIRNGEGFAIDSAGRIFVTQHGRDQLYSNWPAFYQLSQEATLPAEELLRLTPRRRLWLARVLLRSGVAYPRPRAGIRRQRQTRGAMREQDRTHRLFPGALGARRHGALR